MGSVISVFNIIFNILNQIIDGFIQFINTIPEIFESITGWASQLFPAEFVTYIGAFIPILITLMIIRFVRG